jgi:hypothetical protein
VLLSVVFLACLSPQNGQKISREGVTFHISHGAACGTCAVCHSSLIKIIKIENNTQPFAGIKLKNPKPVSLSLTLSISLSLSLPPPPP